MFTLVDEDVHNSDIDSADSLLQSGTNIGVTHSNLKKNNILIAIKKFQQ